MSRQAAADYFGVTVREAAIKQWKALNAADLNPRRYMEDDHFFMAKEFMHAKVWRMIQAMETVFPHITRRMDSFARYYWMQDFRSKFLDYLFLRLNNVVWPLIRDAHSLTKMHGMVNDYMNELATARDGDMFQDEGPGLWAETSE